MRLVRTRFAERKAALSDSVYKSCRHIMALSPNGVRDKKAHDIDKKAHGIEHYSFLPDKTREVSSFANAGTPLNTRPCTPKLSNASSARSAPVTHTASCSLSPATQRVADGLS